MGNKEPNLASRMVPEKELERHPEEAKQNWITKETKRIDAEVEKVAGGAGRFLPTF